MEIDSSVQGKRWQNLIHKKCPNCNNKLEDRGSYWVCPDSGLHKNCFIIHRFKVIQFLTDPTHAANRFLSEHERKTLTEGLRGLGIVV